MRACSNYGNNSVHHCCLEQESSYRRRRIKTKTDLGLEQVLALSKREHHQEETEEEEEREKRGWRRRCVWAVGVIATQQQL